MFKNKTVEEKKAFKDKVVIGVASLSIGIVAGCVISKHGTAINNGIKQGIAIMINSPVTNTTINNIIVEKRGELGHVIVNDKTGEQYGSIAEACKDLGVTRYILKKHFKGEIPEINGSTFSNLGEYGTF